MFSAAQDQDLLLAHPSQKAPDLCAGTGKPFSARARCAAVLLPGGPMWDRIKGDATDLMTHVVSIQSDICSVGQLSARKGFQGRCWQLFPPQSQLLSAALHRLLCEGGGGWKIFHLGSWGVSSHLCALGLVGSSWYVSFLLLPITLLSCPLHLASV